MNPQYRHSRLPAFTLLVLLFTFCLPTIPLHAAVLSGKVVYVSDGDTLTLLSGKQQYKIRLLAIDAPEHDQAFGNSAKKNLSALVSGQSVTVHWQQRDQYQRIIGQVWVNHPDCKSSVCENTIDVNLQQILSGGAWWYRHFAGGQTAADAARYEQAENHARRSRLGLWSKQKPIAPWQWRRTHHR